MLKGLEREFLQTDPTAAVQQIVAFLQTGEDAPTGLSFEVGVGGKLDTAPTLRVVLMDLLGRLDPAEARRQAESVFASSALADEWAVALRNQAWATRDPSDPVLNQQVQKLLENAAWRSAPTTGFLHAFDVAAYTRNPKMAEALVAIVSNPGDQDLVRGAAYLALDRMFGLGQSAVFQVLEKQPKAMADSPSLRAELYARLQLDNPEQRAYLDAYLGRTVGQAEEMQAFLRYFPCADVHAAQGLVTSPVFPAMAALKRNDRAALEQVKQWQADPAFAAFRETLAQAQLRLEQFVASAQAGDREDEARKAELAKSQ